MSPLAPGLSLAGLGAFVGVLALWDRVAEELGAAWRRYRDWAQAGLDWLVLPLRPVDLALRHAIAILAGWSLGVFLSSTSFGVALAVGAAIFPRVWMKRASDARRKRLEEQLDAALQTIANNMLATQSLVDGFAAVAAHLDPPVSEEAAMVCKDIKVGARTEEALTNLAERCQSLHVDAVVTALAIGLRTGGDLGKVLKTIAGVVRETLRCEGLMAAKTAEGRMSAWVMGSMPLLFMLSMHWLSPEWLAPLWSDPVGHVLVVLAAVLTLVGMMLVLKISRIDP